jgi:PucR family transcriptional regulator, purine catabolism regulatory protein
MTINISEALKELPILSTAKVVAGLNSLNREIRWTHIVDNPDVLPWVREGDLLLTTAFSLRDQPEVHRQLIKSLVEKNISGMIISIGRYIEIIPAAMIEAAEEFHFPLIALPWEVPLVEVTHALHERIINEQYALNEKAFYIHKVLTELVLEGGGLEILAEKLADLLKQPVTIEDTDLRILAHSRIEPIDTVRKISIDQARTPEVAVKYFEKIGVFTQLKTDPRPKRIPAVPEIGLDFERIISPIMAGNHCYGYIWIIAADRSLGDLDFLVIERGAMVAALIMSREEAVYQAKQRVKTELFESLMNPYSKNTPFDLAETLKKLGLQSGYQFIILEGVAELNEKSSIRVYQQADRILRSNNLPATVIQWGSRIVVLLGTTNANLAETISQTILKECKQLGDSIVIGISQPETQAARVRQSYQDAIDTLQIGRKLNWEVEKPWQYNQLGFLEFLLNMSEETRINNHYYRLVKAISKYDIDRGSDFLTTMDSYFDHFCNANQTAEDLFIHRNTLRQRLARIHENWNIDFEDPTCVLNLQVAIKSLQLFENME